MDLMRVPVRRVSTVNIRGDPVEIIFVGSLVKQFRVERWVNRIPSRRWTERHDLAAATGPPIA